MDVRKSFPADENTDLTPRIVAAQRRANMVWLVGAVAAFLAGGGISLVAGGNDKTTPAAIDMEAQRVAAASDASAKSAHVQADGVAMTPMVRAGIETDAATMADIAKNEIHFSQNPGETLEIFQVKGTTPATILRVPGNATAIQPILGKTTRLENSGKGSLDVVAGAPVEPQSESKTGGEVALSIPVDLGPTRQRLSELVVEASLTGVGQSLVLVPKIAGLAPGSPINVTIQPSAEWKLPVLTLTAVPVVSRPKWINPARFACFGLGGLMLIIFLIGLRRR